MQTIDFYPYPRILGLLILALVIVRWRKRGWLYVSALGLFGLYLLAVLNKVAFPIILPQHWPAFLSWNDFAFTLTHNVNLIPFNYGNMFSSLAAGTIHPNIVFWEIAGNILLTVPFGLGIGLFHPVRGRRVLWLALAAGLALEGTQLLIMLVIGPSLHSVDINDMLLNALGVVIGSGLHRIAAWGSYQMRVNFAQSRV